MARKHKTPRKSQRRGVEEISVEDLRDISILFPGDVYRLAEWVAMSDLAVSTSTEQRGTTLHGLAKNFALLAYYDQHTWTADEVMARFRQHGLTGNPVVRLRPEQARVVVEFIAGNDAPAGDEPE